MSEHPGSPNGGGHLQRLLLLRPDNPQKSQVVRERRNIPKQHHVQTNQKLHEKLGWH